MPPQPSEKKSNGDWLDLNLPVPDYPLPPFPDLPLSTVYAIIEEGFNDAVYDDAYFARSLASKNPEPFVM